ncbi:MAG: hypothetical protein IT395_04650 [Candidatus Omnitrophica bacterium]|nr:hypothetical protein [Candidatus Omnitrophota bacterium]
MKKYRSLLLIVSVVLILSGCGKKELQMFPPEKALQIALQTKEAQALLNYRNGALAGCLEKKVVKSCDSEWVTCRDNAWVVQYLLTPQCPVPVAGTGQGDGRLGMNFVIDGMTGDIISHYPEVEYFANDRFCRDDADCVGDSKECLNFAAAPFSHSEGNPVSCRCREAQCILKE